MNNLALVTPIDANKRTPLQRMIDLSRESVVLSKARVAAKANGFEAVWSELYNLTQANNAAQAALVSEYPSVLRESVEYLASL